jgi:hypothetical protein
VAQHHEHVAQIFADFTAARRLALRSLLAARRLANWLGTLTRA